LVVFAWPIDLAKVNRLHFKTNFYLFAILKNLFWQFPNAGGAFGLQVQPPALKM
jgi:hypothetical protein